MKPIQQPGCVRSFINKFTQDELDLQVRIFRVLAFIGVFLGLSMAVVSFLQNKNSSTIVNFMIAVVSAGLFFFSLKTNYYRFCILVSIIVVFFGMFTFLYIQKGAYRGGMPFFFILAIIYTLYMLRGKLAILTVSLEILYYTGLLVFPIYYPRAIRWHGSERAISIDTIVGFLTVTTALGITFLIEIYLFDQQHDKLKEANNVKNRFLGNISHEIRTPLNVMLGMTEMILQSNTSPVVHEYAKRISQSGDFLLDLVNNLLDLSKIEAGKLEIAQYHYDPGQIFMKIKEDMDRVAEDKNLLLKLTIADNLPKCLIGDALYIRQIGLNLVSNAIKYTREGEVLIRVFYEDEMLSFTVEDTGIGIQEEQLHVIFDAFSRVDRSRNQTIEGVGLGLSIVKELTAAMDGTVEVRSVYGKGSCFQVRIPQSIGDPAKIRVRVLDEKKSREVQKIKGEILVVDDREENLYVMESLLQRTNMKVTTVKSGQECLDVLKEKRFDLIFLDYMMPEMDGIETIHRIQEQYPDYRIPVVALTADVQGDTRQQLLAEGFCDYLSKPVRIKVLNFLLMKYLGNADQSDAEEQGNESETSAENGQASKETVSTDELRILEDRLSPYGIDVQQGLEQFSGSEAQYRTFASMFLNYSTYGEKVKELVSEEDFVGIRHLVHPVKSSAAMIGANDLNHIAALMEAHALAGDGAYLKVCAPVFQISLERVLNGVLQLGSKETDQPAEEMAESKEQLWEELLKALQYYESSRAQELAVKLKRLYPGSEAVRMVLLETEDRLNAMEFDEAAERVEAFLKRVKETETK